EYRIVTQADVVAQAAEHARHCPSGPARVTIMGPAKKFTERATMPKTPDYFQNKTIVITGAGSGIGRATALIFAREGANVLCADINGEAAQETVNQVNATGAQALATTTDVRSRAAVQKMADAAVSAYGGIDFLLNSAGSAVRRSTFLEIDDDLWKETYDINVNGVFFGMQAALPHML
ncbi:MAG: SDR family NAD(P)-dependent oxidoreductase, partial [Planctomycetota bacterium]|nr:SDR family NAD(P)-dependent oxidoreductase [Planctomycetota bacterium]